MVTWQRPVYIGRTHRKRLQLEQSGYHQAARYWLFVLLHDSPTSSFQSDVLFTCCLQHVHNTIVQHRRRHIHYQQLFNDDSAAILALIAHAALACTCIPRLPCLEEGGGPAGDPYVDAADGTGMGHRGFALGDGRLADGIAEGLRAGYLAHMTTRIAVRHSH